MPETYKLRNFKICFLMFLIFRGNVFWKRIKIGGSVCFPCLRLSFFLFPKTVSTFAKGGPPYAHMHIDDCTCNVCEMRFMKSSLEALEKGGPRRTLGHLSRGFACLSSLFMHLIKCHQWAYGRLPTGRATPLKQG